MKPFTNPRIAAMVTVFALAGAATPAAALDAYELGSSTVTPFLSNRTRVEMVDWFDPGRGGADETYSFFANVIRFGVRGSWKPLAAVVEGQEVQLAGLPDNAALLGPGAVYYANTRDETQRELHIRQGYLRWGDIGGSGVSLQGGRFIFNDGLEKAAKDASLAWIKKARVSQRLLGGFDYTHVGRSFDGGLAVWDCGACNWTMMAGVPTAGGFNISANNDIEDIVVAYGAWTLTEPAWAPRSDLRLFYLYYGDDRGLVATDNRDGDYRAEDEADIEIHTIGGNFAHVQAAGPGDIDFLLWGVWQTGDWESLDHNAYAFSLEAGYRLVGLWSKPWLRVGWSVGSGDDNPDDGDHGTFFQALPTARLYAMTPFYNMMNNNDVFAQLILAPAAGLGVRLDYHYLQVTETEDLVYAGGGATQSKPIFGYAGFPAAGHHELAHFLDVAINYTINDHFTVAGYYGHAFGGDVVDANFAGGSDIDYGYLELTLTL